MIHTFSSSFVKPYNSPLFITNPYYWGSMTANYHNLPENEQACESVGLFSLSPSLPLALEILGRARLFDFDQKFYNSVILSLSPSLPLALSNLRRARLLPIIFYYCITVQMVFRQ